jgi:hypothetical protein
MKYVIVSTETVNLDPGPSLHRPALWEVAWAPLAGQGTRALQCVPAPELIDPRTLTVNRFSERQHPTLRYAPVGTGLAAIREELFVALNDAVIIGSNPWFDMRHLAAVGVPKVWHYHPLDIAAIMIGYLRAHGRWNTADDIHTHALYRRLGIDVSDYPIHTAAGNVELIRDALRIVGLR